MPLVGSVYFSGSRLQCPPASLFGDAFGGLYGAGAYESAFASPWDTVNPAEVYKEQCKYRTSTLQFGCTPCPSGTYALAAGYTDGTPSGHGNGGSGGVVNPVCEPCPFGGVCSSSGVVVSQPGFWGAQSSSGSLSFAVCPSGYCCPHGQSCPTINSCDGGRAGLLCGDCSPGFVQSILSAACVPVDRCEQDTKVFWTCAALGVFCMAFIQLLIVSDLLPHIQRWLRMGTKHFVSAVSSRLPILLAHHSAANDTGMQGPLPDSEHASTATSTSAVVKVLIYFSQVRTFECAFVYENPDCVCSSCCVMSSADVSLRRAAVLFRVGGCLGGHSKCCVCTAADSCKQYTRRVWVCIVDCSLEGEGFWLATLRSGRSYVDHTVRESCS